MRSLIPSTLLFGLIGGTLAGCGGGTSQDSLNATQKQLTRSVKAAVTCFTPWSSTAVYTAGGQSSYANVNYTANWWTQGNNPSTSNGGSGSGQPWTSNGACGTSAPTPTPAPAPTPTPTPTPAPTPTPTPAPTSTIVSGGIYTLVNPNSNKALDVANAGTADGTKVDIWDQNGTVAQMWQVNRNSDGTYTLVNPNSNKALDVYSAATADGTVVDIWDQNGTAAQKWSINANSDGTYTLVNPNSNKALDIYSASTTDGAQIDIWDQNGTVAQKWQLIKAVATPTPTPTPAPTPTPTPAPTPTPTPTCAGTPAPNPAPTCSTASCNWNGNTTFKLLNNTCGKYANNQVYWAIIGKDWNTGNFVHVDVNGNLVPMALADNGALSKNGVAYSNYFHTLADASTVTIPPINSARLMLSVGTPMYLQVNADVNGNIGYAGANIDNPSDPNINVYFDFIEMAIVPGAGNGFFGNTTRVDQFGFPVTLRLQGMDGYDQTVGETETRANLFSEFVAQLPAQFQGLAQAPYSPYRIVAPAHGSFGTGAANATYLDSYINTLWTEYANKTLTFTDQQGTFTGKVVNGVFQFTDSAGTYNVSKPTTDMALLGNGALNDATGTTPGSDAYNKQLQIQAQMCAAINRHIVETPASWSTASAFYASGTAANWYSAFWHQHAINGLSYGFAYDDVGGFSSSLHTTVPTTATVSIGF